MKKGLFVPLMRAIVVTFTLKQFCFVYISQIHQSFFISVFLRFLLLTLFSFLQHRYNNLKLIRGTPCGRHCSICIPPERLIQGPSGCAPVRYFHRISKLFIGLVTFCQYTLQRRYPRGRRVRRERERVMLFNLTADPSWQSLS